MMLSVNARTRDHKTNMPNEQYCFLKSFAPHCPSEYNHFQAQNHLPHLSSYGSTLMRNDLIASKGLTEEDLIMGGVCATASLKSSFALALR